MMNHVIRIFHSILTIRLFFDPIQFNEDKVIN